MKFQPLGLSLALVLFPISLLVTRTYAACNPPDCHNHGTCDTSTTPNTCKCDNGYLPPNCEKHKDPCANDCVQANINSCSVENGVAKCVCRYAYYGSKCQHRFICFADGADKVPLCKNKGKCEGINDNDFNCTCSGPQFEGADCSEYDMCRAPKVAELCGPKFIGAKINVPDCYPCNHGGSCKKLNSFQLHGFVCHCQGYHGLWCESQNIVVAILPSGVDQRVSKFDASAGRLYLYFIVILRRGDPKTTFLKVDTGDGTPQSAYTQDHFQPIEQIRDKNVLSAIDKIKFPNEEMYFIPFRWTYPIGDFVFRVHAWARKSYLSSPYWYYGVQLEIKSTLPPGLNCLPTTKLSDVGHDRDFSVEYRRTSHIAINAELVYDCFGKEYLEKRISSEYDGTFKFHFEWKMFRVSSIFPTTSRFNDWHIEMLTVESDTKYIEFKPHVLLEGLYWIRCTAYVRHDDGFDYGNSDVGYFEIVNNPPHIDMAGGTERTEDANKELILDAGRTLDDSFPEDTGNLEFQWICMSPCKHEDWTGSAITIPSGTFSPDNAIDIFLRVKSQHAKNEASTRLRINFRSKATSSIQCLRNCDDHNPGTDQDFECSYTVDEKVGSADHIQWSWEPARDQVSPVMLEDEPYIARITVPNTDYDMADRHLVCTATPPDIASPIISKYRVEVNQPPIVGNCTVDPPIGEFLRTTFDIVCDRFMTIHTPIIYSFYAEVKGYTDLNMASLHERVLLGHDTNAEVTGMYLPYGEATSNYEFNVIVEGTDDNGLSVEVLVPVTVTRPPESDILALLEDLVFKDDSLMRKMFHRGNIQGGLQLQMMALFVLHDPQLQLQNAKRSELNKLLTRGVLDLMDNDALVFKDTELAANAMNFLVQFEERLEKEVFQNIGEVLIENSDKLAADVHNPFEVTPVEQKDIVASACADMGSRILTVGSEVGTDIQKQQPMITTSNLRDVTDFLEEDGRETFEGQNPSSKKFDRENFEDVSEAAEDDVQDFCNVAKHAMNALRDSADAAASDLAYDEPYSKETSIASIHAQILSRNADDVNIVMKTEQDVGNKMEVKVNIPEGIIDVGVESTNNDLELQVIEMTRNPHCDDTSALPNTPFVSVILKDPNTHTQIPIIKTSVPLEISLPVGRSMTQAELMAGKTSHVPIQVIPPYDLDESYQIPSFKVNLPYNAKVWIEISEVSSPTMIFKMLPMKDRKPILQDFCQSSTIETDKYGYRAEFSSEEIALTEDQEEPYLEYYVGILAFDHENPYTLQNFSIIFTRPTCLRRNDDRKFWTETACMVKDTTVSTRNGSSTSKLERITCLCNHFSLFAGAHFVVPHALDNSNPFADFAMADFEANWTVLITVVVILVIYVIGFAICKYLDRRDVKESLGLTIMADLNESSFTRYYMITIQTGTNMWAGTSSCVCLVMYGSNGRSQIYTMKDKDLTVFRRGAIDTFLVPCDKDLGNLEKIRLWTDHSGHDPAWYCRKILIRHVASNREWFFYIHCCLTVTSMESTVILEIPATLKEDQKKFCVRFKENLSDQFDNSLLWFSLFRFSPSNTFTRCQRLSCAFAVLISYLMWDIVYTGTITEDENGLMEFGDYAIDVYAIFKSISIVMCSLPFSIIIVALFRYIVPKNTPTLIIWKNVIAAGKDIRDKDLFIPNVHGIPQNPHHVRIRMPTGEADIVSTSSSSSNFSVPSTDVNNLEGWLDQRIQNGGRSGVQSDEDYDDVMEEDRYVFNLDLDSGHDEEMDKLKKSGAQAMADVVRQYDPNAFVFKGEFDVAELERRIDQRILEGKRVKPGSSSAGSDPESIKPDDGEEPVQTDRNPLFNKIGKSQYVMDDFSTSGSESGDKESKDRRIINEEQIALELCLLPTVIRPKCSLPWWFIFIAWFVCIAVIIVCSAITIVYGVHYGYLRSMMWLEKFVGSVFMSILIIQPLCSCAVAFIVTVFGRKQKLREMLQVVIQDSNNNKFLESRLHYNHSVFSSFRTYGPLPGNIIFRLKIAARRRKEVRSKLLRLVLCILLLVPLIAFSYGGHYYYDYGITRNIRNMFDLNRNGNEKIQFGNKELVYEYLERVMLEKVHPPPVNFNNRRRTAPGLPYLSDEQTVLIGVGRIRQQRVKPSKCQKEDNLRHNCIRHKSFKKYNQDRGSYHQSWTPVLPGRRRYPPSLNNDGWEFHDVNGPKAKKVMSLPFRGYQGKYDGGGYIIELDRTRRGTKKVLNHVKTVNWLDHRTRAIFLELTLMNPNINKFVDVVILIEQGPTWTFSLKSWITPIELLPFDEMSEKSDEIPWLTPCIIVIVVVTVLNIVFLIKDIFTKQKKLLFCSLGFWLDLAIIAFTLTCLGLCVERFFEAKDVSEKIETQRLDEYLSIQKAAHLDIIQRQIFGVTLVLVYLKTWKLLMFTDKRFLSFSLTIRLTSRFMVAFFIMITVAINAFAFAGFFLFGNEILEFSTWGESLITLMEQILSFSFIEDLNDSKWVLGRIYTACFGIFIVFIGCNFIIALLDIGVHDAKRVVSQRRVWLTYAQYFKSVLFRTFPSLDSTYKKKRAAAHIKTLQPQRLHLMKQVMKTYLRSFLDEAGYHRMKEMEAHINRVLTGTGYKVVSKKYNATKDMQLMYAHLEQLREFTSAILKEKLGHDMKPKEFKEYADFNRTIVALRVQKMEKKVEQLEQKVDEFVNSFGSSLQHNQS